MKLLLIFFLMTGSSHLVWGSEKLDKALKKTSVRYKKGGRIDFESLLIEGESKKPEMSVVTGNIGEKDTGLLKFRKNFNDMMARDFGERIR